MYLSISNPKELEIIGLNINSPYFQALSLQAKSHIQDNLLKWLKILTPSDIPEIPSLENFWIYDINLATPRSPWNITLTWNSGRVTLEDDKDLTLFSALVDNLPPEERSNLNMIMTGGEIKVEFDILRNHTGNGKMQFNFNPLKVGEYPLVYAAGKIVIILPKEAKDFLTGLGKIKEITEVSTRESLMCEIF